MSRWKVSNMMKHPVKIFCLALLAALPIVLGCTLRGEEQKQKTDKPKQVKLGKNVFLEVDGKKRRVLIKAYVCLRQGQLEQFLTRKRTKEHESILAADVDAQKIHAALLAAGAENGNPVKFLPKYVPASGTTIKVTVEYKDKKGKLVREPAQKWIRHIGTKKDLKHDWVFAGSELVRDPFDKTKKPYYSANEGDVICVSNFASAMLDLPIKSSQDAANLFYEAHTERIPPEKTPVTVILEPVLKSKKKDS